MTRFSCRNNPVKMWRVDRFKQNHPADNWNEEQEQESSIHSGSISVL